MLENTRITLESILKADGTISKERINRAIAVLNGDDTPDLPPLEPFVTRAEAARYLRKTPQCIDIYAKKGLLKKVRIGDTSSRTSGITMESLRRLMQG